MGKWVADLEVCSDLVCSSAWQLSNFRNVPRRNHQQCRRSQLSVGVLPVTDQKLIAAKCTRQLCLPKRFRLWQLPAAFPQKGPRHLCPTDMHVSRLRNPIVKAGAYPHRKLTHARSVIGRQRSVTTNVLPFTTVRATENFAIVRADGRIRRSSRGTEAETPRSLRSACPNPSASGLSLLETFYGMRTRCLSCDGSRATDILLLV
jgi:hypothetical protein